MFPCVKPSIMDQVTWVEGWVEGHPALPDGFRIYLAEWRGCDWVYVPGPLWGRSWFLVVRLAECRWLSMGAMGRGASMALLWWLLRPLSSIVVGVVLALVMVFPGRPWASLGLPGVSLVSLGVNMPLWVSLGLPGPPWVSLGLPGSPWASLGHSGPPGVVAKAVQIPRMCSVLTL